eukprot:TRINITY_DN2577_c5_g1_i2.p1 TRINITY_DN2577_c5_g1~~TRINITY_DN2577_c5_g1_i2.p1  ORF type:complete len:120 (-),score=42.78 TRINITY_DN2577_c5_g1_i2:49-408(-)
MAQILIRVKFPPNCLLLSKTILTNSNQTVEEAIVEFCKIGGLSTPSNYSLFVPDFNSWLEKDQILSLIPQLASVDEVILSEKVNSNLKRKEKANNSKLLYILAFAIVFGLSIYYFNKMN